MDGLLSLGIANGHVVHESRRNSLLELFHVVQIHQMVHVDELHALGGVWCPMHLLSTPARELDVLFEARTSAANAEG